VRDRPGVVLTRHFFRSLFDFGFLSDDGAESLKRALLGSLAVAIAIGLLLTRVFMAKYGALSAGPAAIYERAVRCGSSPARSAWWAARSFRTARISGS
jgi:hypothetical protein